MADRRDIRNGFQLLEGASSWHELVAAIQELARVLREVGEEEQFDFILDRSKLETEITTVVVGAKRGDSAQQLVAFLEVRFGASFDPRVRDLCATRIKAFLLPALQNSLAFPGSQHASRSVTEADPRTTVNDDANHCAPYTPPPDGREDGTASAVTAVRASDSQISPVTRRDLFARLRDYPWSGRISQWEFLGRLFPLAQMPFDRRRFAGLAEEIVHLQVEDFGADYHGWVFTDPRFDLLNVPDEVLLRFLELMLHPEVLEKESQSSWLLNRLNPLLRRDGFEFVADGRMSGRRLFRVRDLKAERESGQPPDAASPANGHGRRGRAVLKLNCHPRELDVEVDLEGSIRVFRAGRRVGEVRRCRSSKQWDLLIQLTTMMGGETGQRNDGVMALVGLGWSGDQVVAAQRQADRERQAKTRLGDWLRDSLGLTCSAIERPGSADSRFLFRSIRVACNKTVP